MKKPIHILRVDPLRRLIVPMRPMLSEKDASRDVKKLIRASTVGWRELMRIGEMPLVAAGAADVDESMSGWRIQGGEDTAGISILFGRSPFGGMFNVPVTADWLRERIQWIDGEDVEGRADRAADAVAMMDEDLRAAFRAAVPAPDGGMWLRIDHQALFPAVLALALGTESTKGQRLTPTGEVAFDLLTGGQG